MRKRFVIFDCDGTLVDSLGHIRAAMTHAFVHHGHEAPDAAAVRAVIGLPLAEAVRRVGGFADIGAAETIAATYKRRYGEIRQADAGAEPLFPGTDAMLRALSDAGHVLGIATGKSRRGLEAVLAHYDYAPLFAVTRTGDDGPGKPDPWMVEDAMREAGADPQESVVIGDTTFDMEMARAAGVEAIGVAWGYHARAELERAGAACVITRFDALPALVGAVGEGAA